MNEQPSDQPEETSWFVYILRCADDTLYTGVTTNLARRLQEHNSSAGGARYTRARRPVSMIYAENVINRSAACSREYQLKRFSRAAKEKLIGNYKKRMTLLKDISSSSAAAV